MIGRARILSDEKCGELCRENSRHSSHVEDYYMKRMGMAVRDATLKAFAERLFDELDRLSKVYADELERDRRRPTNRFGLTPKQRQRQQSGFEDALSAILASLRKEGYL